MPESNDRRHLDAVKRYYNKTESLFGYKVILGGTKHFGYYSPTDRALPFGRALRRMEAFLAEQLDVDSGSVVLDAGCGMGVVACEVARLTGARIEGIDILDFNLEAGKSRARDLGLADRVNFTYMDYASLDFPDESFDAVYTMETLVHSSAPKTVLHEFKRVLKPGGKLVLIEYSRDRPENMSDRANWAFEYVNELAAMPAFQELYHGELEKLLEETGFRETQVEDLTANIMPMLRAFQRLAYVPYRALSAVGKQDKAINAMSAVEFYRYRDHFKYQLYTARR